MNDNQRILIHQLEMLAHSKEIAEFLYKLIGGGVITPQQIKETLDFCIAKMKRDIESNPNLTQEQKDYEISTRESLFNALKLSMGL